MIMRNQGPKRRSKSETTQEVDNELLTLARLRNKFSERKVSFYGEKKLPAREEEGEIDVGT